MIVPPLSKFPVRMPLCLRSSILSLCLLLGVTLQPHDLRGQEGSQRWYKVQVKEGSIQVAGSTNVNEFSCAIDEDKGPQALRVALMENETHLFFSSLHLDFPVEGFQCAIPGMRSDMCELLMAQRYPKIEMEIYSIKVLEDRSTMDRVKVHTTVLLRLAGRDKRLLIKESEVLNLPEDQMLLSGHFALRLTDFGLEPPQKMLGMVRVNDEIDIAYRVRLQAQLW